MLSELIGITVFPLFAEESDVVHQQLGCISHILSPCCRVRFVIHIVSCCTAGCFVCECTCLTVTESEELEGVETTHVLSGSNGLIVFVVVTFPFHIVPLL